MIRPDQFGQGQVVSAVLLVGFRESRAGIHRGAKAGICGGGALDGDDEQVFAPKFVLSIDEGWGHEHTVLECDGSKFAGASAEDCQGFADCWCFAWVLRVFWASMPVRFGCVREDRVGGEEEFFPGGGSEVEVKEFLAFGTVWSFLDLVEGWGLRVGPALGELAHGGQFIVDDGVLFDGRSDDAEALGQERIEEGLEVFVFEPGGRGHWGFRRLGVGTGPGVAGEWR